MSGFRLPEREDAIVCVGEPPSSSRGPEKASMRDYGDSLLWPFVKLLEACLASSYIGGACKSVERVQRFVGESWVDIREV